MQKFLFKNIQKTLSDRIEKKKGSLFLTIYFLTMVHSGFLQHHAGMKRMLYNVLTPDIFLDHPFLEDE